MGRIMVEHHLNALRINFDLEAAPFELARRG